jgi:hypothetical protein
MINATPSLKAAEGLSGKELAMYLGARGWTSRASKIDGISIFSKEIVGADNAIDLILPIKPGFADERRRVADALRTLAEIEREPEIQIANDVRRAVPRSVQIHKKTPPNNIVDVADFWTRPAIGDFLTDAEIEHAALQLRENLGVSNDMAFNIVDLLEKELPRIIADFRIEIFTESQLEENIEAYSRPFPPRIFLRSDVRRLGFQGDPRSRFTIAHEFAHLWLSTNSRYDWHQRSGELIRIRLRKEEEQAGKLAAAFLMPIDIVERVKDPTALAYYCKVSVEAAEYRMTRAYRLYYRRRARLPDWAYSVVQKLLMHALRRSD